MPCGSSRPRASLLAASDRLLDHGFVHGDDVRAGVRGIELETADDAPEGLAKRARTEALLACGVPGDSDQCAARDLQVDTKPFKVRARRWEDRRLRLDEDARQIGFAEIIEHNDRFETGDELRRHAVAEQVVVLQ